MRRNRRNRRDIFEIVKYIKTLLLPKSGKVVHDYQVAEELNITSNRLAACKKRDVIPYEDLLYYCQKNNISADKLFFQ